MSSSPAKPVTPRSLGYSMPAEWAPHRATWLSWPHNLETWPDLKPVRDVWIQMISALSPHERVYLLVNDKTTEQEVVARLKKAGAAIENVEIFQIPTIDVWIRDYGPTFVTRDATDQPLAFNDWIFNGWGGKYKGYEDDDHVARQIGGLLKIPVFDHKIILEGGSIEVNGSGICLTTEQCLLNKNRNPHLSRREIEQCLQESLGVDLVIWLGEGIVGDDTDGHIDDIARFIDARTVVTIVESNPKDENYGFLQDNYERLKAAKNQNSEKLSIVTLPCPSPLYYEGTRLPASYANFYIADAVVLVPIFDDANDGKALGILQELFPNRKIIGLRCNEVVAGLGAIHCVTQQEPAVKSSRA